MNPQIVFYHDDCNDGLSCAALIQKLLREKGLSAIFRPYAYRTGLTPADLEAMEGKDVMFVDTAIKAHEYDAAKRVAKSLIVLDHHKSSLKDLANKEGVILDMNVCGCVLAWRYFKGIVTPVPRTLLMVQERDLFQFERKDSPAKPLAYGLNEIVLQRDIDAVERVLFDEGTLQSVITRGEVIKDQIARLALEKALQARHCVFEYNHEGVRKDIPFVIVESATNATDIGHVMAHAYDKPAAIYCKRNDGKYSVSLRSEDGLEDVCAVAQTRGGGGHRNASGFECDNIDQVFIVK